jgi:prevent-host-death family protein
VALKAISDYVIGQDEPMTTISLAEAKAKLSELVERAASGETVCITRRGKPIAQITAAQHPREPIDATSLKRLTDTMSPQTESAGEFVRQMRDDDRY